MRRMVWCGLLAVVGSCAGAQTVSYTGTLASPEDMFSTTVTVGADGSIGLQTYGFGGGVNAAGTAIAPGGFDPFVGVFEGTGDTAMFVDGNSDVLLNFTPGCGPAGLVTIGSFSGQCGDVAFTLSGLSAGTYTVLLTDADYLPAAVFETGGMLGDGFFDLTGGAFQTCVDASDCNNDTANWALDVTAGTGSTVPGQTPEPPAIELVGMGMVFVVAWMYGRGTREAKGEG